MKDQKKEHSPQKCQRTLENLDLAKLNALKRLPDMRTKCSPDASSPANVYQAPIAYRSSSELLAFVENPKVGYVVKVTKIAAIHEIDVLIDIAAGDGPMPARKNALLRIDELCNGTHLEKDHLKRLIPCLNEKDLIAFTVVIMDMSDYDWCQHCSERTVRALCAALHECSNMHESVLLEDTFAHLAHSRRDLNRSLYFNSPERFLTSVVYAPIGVTNAMLIDLSQDSNVA